MDTVINGLIDFFRSGSQSNPLPHADFKEHSQRTLYSSGVDYAPCNGVIEKQPENFTETEINDIVHYFSSKKLPFIWWTDNHALQAKGFQFGGVMKGIVLNTHTNAFSSAKWPKELTINIVQTSQEFEAFSKILFECFGLNGQAAQQYAVMSEAAMKKGEQVHFLAYFNQVPVGVATLTTMEKSSGIWNFGVLPDYRKKGIGSALVMTALREAEKKKYQNVMAILMPKGLAANVFYKLGFKATCDLPFYVYGADADALEK